MKKAVFAALLILSLPLIFALESETGVEFYIGEPSNGNAVQQVSSFDSNYIIFSIIILVIIFLTIFLAVRYKKNRKNLKVLKGKKKKRK
jgi:heme/copper-type cytochrome/quinol oxidase subunit 2